MLRQQHDTAERRKRFLSSFLYFTKRRTKCRLRRRKDLIGLCENVFLVHCSEVCKTSELPGKVLIVAVRSCGYSVLLRGLQNLETPCKGERIVTFCIVQKVTKKHARTCKKLPVASFCASETAETGRIANGREQGDHVSRRRRSPATSIQIAGRYVFEAKVTGFHQVTGNAENSSFPGIAGNDLNRCEVPALQHKELERTAKEQPHSLQTVG